MTALAGIWSFADRDDLQRQVSTMLGAQAEFGPGDPSLLRLGAAVLGRRLYRLLPEDDFDLQPLVSECGDFLLIGDVRLDNREELIDGLGLYRGLQASDSFVLLRAYERWGEDALDRIVGDFAFVIWNRSSETLTLVRDPFGQRPLHYHLGPDFAAFASMPQGLHALSTVPKTLDRERLARFVADLPKDASETYFKNISRVEPGQVLKISRRGVEARRYWHPPTKDIRYRDEESYAEAFREHLDRATKARLRGAGSLVAAHLSAGLDSGGVASTAARLMAGPRGRVVAFTSAPRDGFSGPVPRAESRMKVRPPRRSRPRTKTWNM
jgi:asparagine synthase (glutamine-hydrolysing)